MEIRFNHVRLLRAVTFFCYCNIHGLRFQPFVL